MIKPNNELSAGALLDVLALADAAMAVYTSESLHISFANDAMLRLWGKQRNVIGKTLPAGVPELSDQPFIGILQSVWRTGKIYIGTEIPAELIIDGVTTTAYFDFEYRAIANADGTTYAIIHTAADVTARVTYKHLAKEKQDREQQLYEELQAANEELRVAGEEQAAVNDELTALNEEYLATNEQLIETSKEREALNNALEKTNRDLQSLNEEYLAINDQLVETANEREALNKALAYTNEELHALNEEYLATNEQLIAIDKDREELNRSLEETNEENATLNEELTVSNEELQELNQEYVALNEIANINLEQAQLAKQAASLGMFDLDVVNDKLEWDDRCKELFGLSPSVKVTYSVDFVKGLHQDDKKRILKAVNDAYNQDLTGGQYDVVYRTIGAEDKKLRWVRAIGKVTFNIDKKPLRFIGTVMDITEQKEDELRKNDFIGMVSHELKTPLTSLNGYLQVMQSKVKKAEDPFLNNIAEKSVLQVKKMTTIINGFLNVSRFESGKIHIDLLEFDLAELVKEVEEESIATVATHNVIFHPIERTMIVGDRDKIGQVINNLIGNAVKYSPQGTTINLACVAENGYVKLSVEDQGMGIDQKDLGKLFDRYYRVEGSHMKSISGFGIGLYLCSEIIKRHGGEIGANSELGKGSTFWFKLPQDLPK